MRHYLFWVAAPEVVDHKDTFLFHRERQGLAIGLLHYFEVGLCGVLINGEDIIYR